MIPPRQNLGAVQMGVQNVAGSMNPSGGTLHPGGPTNPRQLSSQEVRQEQASALMSLIQSQIAAQQNFGAPKSNATKPTTDNGSEEIYQFLMSQGRRVYYTPKE